MTHSTSTQVSASAGHGSRARVVAAGILTSRVLGLVRQATISYFFGIGPHADVYEAALRGPNLLQNLLGEGTISAAFVPVYSRLLEQGRARDAGRFAGAVLGLLLAVAALVVMVGILLAEPLVTVLTPGFVNDASKVAAGTLTVNRFELTVQAIRLIFPMTGVLVLSAWALGVLNSHRRFFLPYVAPVLWNIAIIGSLVGASVWLVRPPVGGGTLSVEGLNRLLFAAFAGALVGGILQFLIQLPLVFRVMRGFRLSLSTRVDGLREALTAFGPVVAGRGVYQLSGYLDVLLASLLAAGALAAVRPALMLYLLPVSLFGQSVAASELPELSRLGADASHAFVDRLQQSIRQSLFLIVPATIGYLGVGFLIVGGLLRRGEFGLADNWLVYVVLAGYSSGLVATTVSRLLHNGFWALGDTRTPAKIAGVRVVASAVVAVPMMFWLDRLSVTETFGLAPDGAPLFMGAFGLALGATVGAWLELWRLATALRRQLVSFGVPWRRACAMSVTSVTALAPAVGLWWLCAAWPMLPLAVVVVGSYGAIYLGVSRWLGATELQTWTGRIRTRG
ncbi:MAG: murein biosynthesis integral membrane protein MurJ [Acidobacteriota bacterium]|nr:murein biosynthesis integral membrane protein MurJ [Acidobacteriota bacterium]